jgi:hypothetical protein
MEFMDKLSFMMMMVMIKDMMLVTMLGMSFVTPFTPKNCNVQTHKQNLQHVCLSSL